MIAEAIRQAGRIERSFRRAGASMRAGDERGVACERHAAEYDLRRSEVIDRLKERRAARKDLGNLRRNRCAGLSFDADDNVRPDQWWWYAVGVMPAVRVRAKVGQRVAIDRTVPDDVVGPAADRRAV